MSPECKGWRQCSIPPLHPSKSNGGETSVEDSSIVNVERDGGRNRNTCWHLNSGSRNRNTRVETIERIDVVNHVIWT